MKVWVSGPQPSLFDRVDQSKFEEYHRDNPQVYEMFKRFTFEKISRGAKHVGAKAVLERVRWETSVSGDDGFKVNNNYTAAYARLFAKDFPQHKDLFRTRKARIQHLQDSV
jgi:hypothetical protein